jgi:hypothetical protein
VSSHKEAPAISQDPVADSTDVYAFMSPNRADTVTIICNYVPLQTPAAGPNFAEFGAKTQVTNGKTTGEDVLYEINIDNDGSGKPSITYQFKFSTHIIDASTFLYNTGPITHENGSVGESHGRYSLSWNRRQMYTVTKVEKGKSTVLRNRGGVDFSCPPCNVGVRSTPNYGALAEAAIYELPDGMKVFAGQRADGFFVDLGSIFDLGDLRPISADQAFPPHTNTKGVRSRWNSSRATARSRPAPTTRTPSSACGPPPAARRRACSTRPPVSPAPAAPTSRCPVSGARWSTRSSSR